MNGINIRVKIDKNEHHMFINAGCQLLTFVSIVEEKFKMKVTSVKHYDPYDVIDLLDCQKRLIEDYGIEYGHYLDVSLGHLPPNRQKRLFVEFSQQTFQIMINDHTEIGDLINMMSDLLEKDTINIYFNDRLLTDKHQKLSSYGITDEATVKITEDYKKSETTKKYVSDTCIICLDTDTEMKKVYECGHVNICVECTSLYKKKKCPWCE